MTDHDFTHIPAELKAIPRWVCWHYGKRGDKLTKIPRQAKAPSRNAKSTDPPTWATFEEALAAYEANEGIAGIGFVFTDDDDITGIDIDHCFDPETGGLAPEAAETVALLDSYTETTPSGEGLHIIVRGHLPGKKRRKGLFECYETGRFFTFTGNHLVGTPTTVCERSGQLGEFYEGVFGKPTKTDTPAAPPVAMPPTNPEDVGLRADDRDIGRTLSRGRNGTKFKALFEGDWQHAGDYTSQSEADLALCSLIADKTDNPVQIDRLFRASGLMRPKWDEQHGELTYGQMTIVKALESRAQTSGAQPTYRDMLLELADDLDLFCTPRGDAYASLQHAGHRETYALSSTALKRLLTTRFYNTYDNAPNPDSLSAAIATLDARAHSEGKVEEVFCRLGYARGRIYLDLADEDWRVVEIDTGGWRVLSMSPVHFSRSAGMQPIPEPVHGGSLGWLRGVLNLPDDEQFALVLAWLVGAMHPKGPYPILILQGEQGSAKSTTARLLRSLIDPARPPMRSAPSCARDLMIAASSSWVLAFDNLSAIKADMSDVFCQLATGAGFATRRLYTDDEETIFDAKRPILMNGISDLAKREDLASRAITIRLPHIPPDNRRTEREIASKFDKLQPRLVGALLDAVSTALARVGEVELEGHPRMADFAAWVVAAEPALTIDDGAFMSAYKANLLDAVLIALESDSVAMATLKVAFKYPHGWIGTMTGLLKEINDVTSGFGDHKADRYWPMTPRALSDRLSRLGDFLHTVGVSVTKYRETTGKRRGLVEVELDPEVKELSIGNETLVSSRDTPF